MVVKVRSLKAHEEEIKLWEDAAKKALIDDRPSLNHWVRKVLNRAAKRVLRNNES